MSASLVKIVNIVESNVNNDDNDNITIPEENEDNFDGNLASAKIPVSAILKELELENQRKQASSPADEIPLAEPTFSERFMRHFIIVIYLCGLCSVGFVLSIYHLFFWDSRMPPVYKAAVAKKPLYIKP